MPHTIAQSAAITAPSHSVIIANAGSGKTFTLVEKYLYLLENYPNLIPSQIIAITFTENAAKELEEKIIKGIREKIDRLETEKGAKVLIDRFWKVLYEIDSAHISTIHTFCSRLLRSHPIEAGLDPAFTVIEGIERRLLIDECISSVFHDILSEHYKGFAVSRSAYDTFKYYGRSKLQSIISAMLDRGNLAGSAADYFRARTDSDILADCDELFKTFLSDIVTRSTFQQSLSDLFSLIKDGGKGEEAKESYLEFKSFSQEEIALGPLGLFFNVILTKESTPQTAVFGRKETADYQTALQIVEAIFDDIITVRKLLAAYTENSTQTNLSLTHQRNILSLFQLISEKYFEEKNNFGFLDHDDLIDRAVTLLSDESTAAEIAAEYTFCLIDEYQDTDDRQYRLLNYLTNSYRNHVTATLVGDPKQSIYRFREADLAVFHQTVNETLAATGAISPIELRETFRMVALPLAIVNQVTDILFAQPEKYFYKPLIQGLTDPMRLLHTKNYDGETALLISDQREEKKIISEPEESLIVKSILSLVNDSNGVVHRDFKDIAILLRNRSKLPSLELHLKVLGIPYSVSGGVGFYQQQEIIDVITFLKVLIDPDDDLSLVGILRSPFVGFSDLELWNITHQKQQVKDQHSLWNFLTSENYELTEVQKSRLLLLTEVMPLAGKVSTAELLRILIRKSAIELIYYSFSDGEQKVSNLKKLVELSSRCDLSIWEFVEQCNLFQERSEREQQADAEPTENAVRIMTVHASKGLQFPVVFLPYFNDGKKRGRNSSILMKQLPYIKLEGIGDNGETIVHPITELVKLIETREEFEEEKRIFYVAMTRAEHGLYVSATLEKDKIPENTPLAWFTEAFGITATDLIALPSFPLNKEITIYDSQDSDRPYRDRVIERMIPIIKTVDVGAIAETKSIAHPLQRFEIDLSKIESVEGITRYSPTQLLTYLECPTKYYLRYKLGIPEIPKEAPAEVVVTKDFDPSDQSEQLQTSLYGQLLHKIFEKIESLVQDRQFLPPLLSEAFEQLKDEYHIDEERSKYYYNRLLREAEVFQTKKLFGAILSAKESYSELPLRLALEEKLMLSGIIDRMFLDSDGIWNIVDYKTASKPLKVDKERYNFQLRFYCYLVMRLFDVSMVKSQLYFTATGETVSSVVSNTDGADIHSLLSSTVAKIVRDIHTEEPLSLEKNRQHCPDCYFSTDRESTCLVDVSVVSM